MKTRSLHSQALMATVVLLATGWTNTVTAGSIASRAELQNLLVGPGTIEDFEAPPIPADGGSGVFCSTGNTLSASSVCSSNYGSLGPGLVDPGISLIKTSGDFQWHGANFFWSPSRELLVVGGELIIDFADPVGAFGLDLRGLGSPYTGPAELVARGPDDTTVIGTIPVFIGDAAPVFAGWADVGGIGSLRLTLVAGHGWTPTIDNLQWGAIVPAPAPLALLVSGLAGLAALGRRKGRADRTSPGSHHGD